MLAAGYSKGWHCRDLILEDRDISLGLEYKEIFFVVFKCFDLVNGGQNWLKLVDFMVFEGKPRFARFFEVLDKKSSNEPRLWNGPVEFEYGIVSRLYRNTT